MKNEFNARAVLGEVRAVRRVCRKRKTWRKLVLTKYLAELTLLKNEGASLADMRFWLHRQKRVKVARSTIKRALDKVKPVAIGKN